MKEILKAMREQKKINLDVYKKGTSLAFWIMLEKNEILIVSNKTNLEGKILDTEEIADQEQDKLLAKGYKPIKITEQVINEMGKLQTQMMKKVIFG